jgi:hypothetical protein
MAKVPLIEKEQNAPHQAALEAIARGLQPLAKLSLKAGLGAGDLAAAVKLACVRAAAEDKKANGRLNHSRISAITGLTRKEVRALAAAMENRPVPLIKSAPRQRTARVIRGWKTDPLFLDEAGEPGKLTIAGSEESFHALVKRYAGDVTPVSVLKELEKTGAVRRTRAGQVQLLKSSTRLRAYSNDVIFDLAKKIHDLAAALVQNAEQPDNPTFVGSQDLLSRSPEEAALFQTTFAERAAALLDGVGRWADIQKKLHKTKPSGAGSSERVGIGVYLMRQTGHRPAAAASTPKRRSAR